MVGQAGHSLSDCLLMYLPFVLPSEQPRQEGRQAEEHRVRDRRDRLVQVRLRERAAAGEPATTATGPETAPRHHRQPH